MTETIAALPTTPVRPPATRGRSPRTACCPTAPPPRSSAVTARSTGSACRASTAQPSSPASSTPTPATGRSGPPATFTTERRYLPNSLVLETTFTTDTGTVRLLDALVFAEGQRGHDLGLDAPRELLRSVAGVSGSVDVVMELAPRPEYGLVRPLFRQTDDGGRTFGGPNQIIVRAAVPTEIDGSTMRAAFTVAEGDEIGFSLRWSPAESTGREPTAPDAVAARIADTVEGWRSWESEHDVYEGRAPRAGPCSARGC